MASAQMTEIIWHFAGYLKIFHDISRGREAYGEIEPPPPPENYVTPRPDYDHVYTPDDLTSYGLRVAEPIIAGSSLLNQLPPIKPFFNPSDPDFDFFPAPRPPVIQQPAGGGGGGGEPFIEVKYEPGGEQGIAEIRQRNVMYDDDSLNVPSDHPMIAQLRADASSTISAMVEEANSEIPQQWHMSQNNAGVVEFIAAHDAEWAARDTPDANSVAPGYYVNGVLQSSTPEIEGLPVSLEQAPLPDTGKDIGQWAVLGDNTSINAGLIVDLGESGRTMIVKGDYFTTNGVLQTNSTMDNDHVAGAGGKGVSSGDNSADNIADFASKPDVWEGVQTTYGGMRWNVDVVDGNFYSISTFVQFNYLFDNDVAAQVSSDTHYDLIGGYNWQANAAQVFDGAIHYDLIVVDGAYHGMNLIFQNNVLLNNDRIMMANGDSTHPDGNVNSGGNALLNEALIESYGGNNFKDMNAGMEALLAQLASGATQIDTDFGKILPGSGGTFNVLYVKGDYYDINAIWQTNITSDINVIYQLQNNPSLAALAEHPDGAQTQFVKTGGDNLTNDATIVDVGPTNTYVGGTAYSDTILVQANLLPTGHDASVNSDTHALVTELIAFVNESHDDSSAAHAPAAYATHADPIGSMLV